MRILFAPPSENEFKKLFSINRKVNGGGLNDITVFNPSVRRGGGIFSTIARRVLPFLFNTVKPVVKEFGKNVASDILLNNKPWKETLKKRGVTALKETGRRVFSGSGSSRVRKKSTRVKRDKIHKKRMKKHGIKDVYSLI